VNNNKIRIYDYCFNSVTDRASTYFLSKSILELPLTFVQTLVQYILVYFMVNMQGNFILIVLIAWGLGAASCSVAVLLGCLVADVKDVAEMAPLLFVPQLLFAGFFIRTSLIPIFLRWAQWLCALKYAMNLVLLTEFNKANKSCQDGAAHNCKNVIEVNDIKEDMVYAYVLILVALFVAFRLVGGMILVRKARRFY
jgi:ABC-2 type transporter